MFVRSLSCVVVVAALSLQARSAEVEVTGVHLCCGACVQGVKQALVGIEGVTRVTGDRKSKSVRFAAADDKAAAAGIQALAEAGFHGAAKHGDTAIAFPDSGAQGGSQASRIRISNVHLCCAACVRAADEAIRKIDGVENVTADRDASAIEVTGDNVGVEAVVKALNDAGFHATVQP